MYVHLLENKDRTFFIKSTELFGHTVEGTLQMSFEFGAPETLLHLGEGGVRGVHGPGLMGKGAYDPKPRPKLLGLPILVFSFIHLGLCDSHLI